MTAPTVAVTGAAGDLGRRVIRALVKRRCVVRGLGRGPVPSGFSVDWTTVDLLAADGLALALEGADVVVHCASDPRGKDADVHAARHLAQAARDAGVSHIIYVQIAGITDAADVFRHYRSKIIAGQILNDADVPCTIAAATQFHGLIDRVFRVLGRGPIIPLPNFKLQPVDANFFAERLADQAMSPDPQGFTVCGPQTLTSKELLATWLEVSAQRKPVIIVPGVGALAAFGRIRSIDGLVGGCSWREWLTREPEGQ